MCPSLALRHRSVGQSILSVSSRYLYGLLGLYWLWCVLQVKIFVILNSAYVCQCFAAVTVLRVAVKVCFWLLLLLVRVISAHIDCCRMFGTFYSNFFFEGSNNRISFIFHAWIPCNIWSQATHLQFFQICSKNITTSNWYAITFVCKSGFFVSLLWAFRS